MTKLVLPQDIRPWYDALKPHVMPVDDEAAFAQHVRRVVTQLALDDTLHSSVLMYFLAYGGRLDLAQKGLTLAQFEMYYAIPVSLRASIRIEDALRFHERGLSIQQAATAFVRTREERVRVPVTLPAYTVEPVPFRPITAEFVQIMKARLARLFVPESPVAAHLKKKDM